MSSTNDIELSAYAKRIQHGLALANRKMMETAAAFDRPLVISHNGEPWHEEPARELLANARQTVWWKSHFKGE